MLKYTIHVLVHALPPHLPSCTSPPSKCSLLFPLLSPRIRECNNIFNYIEMSKLRTRSATHQQNWLCTESANRGGATQYHQALRSTRHTYENVDEATKKSTPRHFFISKETERILKKKMRRLAHNCGQRCLRTVCNAATL